MSFVFTEILLSQRGYQVEHLSLQAVTMFRLQERQIYGCVIFSCIPLGVQRVVLR